MHQHPVYDYDTLVYITYKCRIKRRIQCFGTSRFHFRIKPGIQRIIPSDARVSTNQTRSDWQHLSVRSAQSVGSHTSASILPSGFLINALLRHVCVQKYTYPLPIIPWWWASIRNARVSRLSIVNQNIFTLDDLICDTTRVHSAELAWKSGN